MSKREEEILHTGRGKEREDIFQKSGERMGKKERREEKKRKKRGKGTENVREE